MRTLIVEDDPSIAEPLAEVLRLQGHEPVVTGSGEQALRLAAHSDLVLLDLGLPDLDGFEVCRRLRGTSQVPVIVVSARDGELDRVLGLELGADDYLVKPFSLRELVARIHAVSRRVSVTPTPTREPAREFAGLRVDRRERRASLRGCRLELTPKEFDLLAALVEDPGAVCRRVELLGGVWGEPWFGSTKVLDVHVAALRRKLGDARWVETVRGVGFRLVDPLAEPP